MENPRSFEEEAYRDYYETSSQNSEVQSLPFRKFRATPRHAGVRINLDLSSNSILNSPLKLPLVFTALACSSWQFHFDKTAATAVNR